VAAALADSSPRRQSRLQDWTGHTPLPFLRGGQSQRSGSSAHIAVRTLAASEPCIVGDLATQRVGTSAQPRASHRIADHEWRCWPLHKNAVAELAHIGRVGRWRQGVAGCRSSRSARRGRVPVGQGKTRRVAALRTSLVCNKTVTGTACWALTLPRVSIRGAGPGRCPGPGGPVGVRAARLTRVSGRGRWEDRR
jgi:hypothetical protein